MNARELESWSVALAPRLLSLAALSGGVDRVVAPFWSIVLWEQARRRVV